MQTGISISSDPNAVHPQEIRPDDPRHLNNLTRKMKTINAQVSADTKYDPAPPPRVDRTGKPVKEAFVSPIPPTTTNIMDDYLYIVGALALIIIIMAIVLFIDPKSNAILARIDNGFSLLAGATLVSTITLVFVAYARYWNDVITWYPQLRY